MFSTLMHSNPHAFQPSCLSTLNAYLLCQEAVTSCSSSSLRLLINHFMPIFLMLFNPHAFQPSCFLILMFFNPHVCQPSCSSIWFAKKHNYCSSHWRACNAWFNTKACCLAAWKDTANHAACQHALVLNHALTDFSSKDIHIQKNKTHSSHHPTLDCPLITSCW